MIEFMRWYCGGQEIVRCSGDSGCGALLVSGDTEFHLAWHAKIERALSSLAVTHTPKAPVRGVW